MTQSKTLDTGSDGMEDRATARKERMQQNFAALKAFWASNPNIRVRPGALNDDQREAIAAAMRAGKSRCSEIAVDYLVCEASIKGIAKEMGCSRSMLRGARDQQIVKRLETGALYKDVARAFGLTMKCVAKIARRNGIVRLKRVSLICAEAKTRKAMPYGRAKKRVASGRFVPICSNDNQTTPPTGGGQLPNPAALVSEVRP